MPTISLSVSVRSSLRSSTAVLPYAVNNFDPDFVLDFKNSVYKTGGTETTLNLAVTHARAGNATMTDSDGKIKWTPHNFLASSDAFADTSVTLWSNFGSAAGPHEEVVMSNGATGYRFDVTNDRDFMSYSISVVTGTEYTVKLWIDEVDYTSGNNQFITIFGETNSSIVQSSFTGAGFYSFTYTSSSTSTKSIRIGAGSSSNTTLNFVCGQPHFYRSDLGGMVNNPETGNSYVPTTSSPVYLPRTGHHVYNGSAWVNEGILHESEARTNLYTTSEETNTSGSFAITKTSDSTVSPAGTTTTDLITPTTADDRHLFQYSSSFSSGSGQETYSFYAKSNGYNIIEVAQRNQGGGTITKFDLSAVTATTTSGTEIFNSIEDVGNGWYRCSASYITSSTRPYPAIEFLDTDGSQGFVGDGTSGIYFWGHQLEAGSTPSSYIPTSGATATRAAETLTVPAANLPYNSTNMSIQIDGKMTYADDGDDNGEVFRWHLDSSNNIYSMLSTYLARTGQIYWVQESGNVLDSVSGPDTSYSPDVNVPFNFASRYGSTFLNGAIDGTALTANTTPTALPDLSSTNLNLGYGFMGTIGKFRMWDEDLTDTGIEEAST